MAAPVRVYIFGDQTFDTNASLADLLQWNEDPILTTFFEKSCSSLRREIAKVDRCANIKFPLFSNLADLNALHSKGELNPALAQFLTCTCQLGLFIRLHGPYGLSYPTAESSCLVGLCTGTLSAAAVSCSRSLPDLLDAAVQATTVAFRAGFCSWDVSRRISSDESNGSRSWALAVSGISLENASLALADFSEAQCVPKLSMPYISLSSSSTQMTVSGPPDVLAKLRDWPAFARCTTYPLPICAPYHAPHLFGDNDIKHVLGDVLPPEWSSRFSRIPVIPHEAGVNVPMSNFNQTIRCAVDAILRVPVQWDLILEQITLPADHDQKICLEMVPIATKADRFIRPAIERLISAKGYHGALVKTLNPLENNVQEPSWTPAGKAGIAIVSVSGRFPSASGMDEFWDLLQNGLDVHKVVPPVRWDANTHFDPITSRKNTSGTPYGCWLDDAGLWDSRFFNISPREAPQIDPAQRLALLTAAEAIEKAGIVPDRTPSTRRDRVGIWYGCTSNDWMETNSAQNIDAYFIPGGNRAFIPGRINYHYKFSGPSFAIDTACSSSLSAIHMACNALWRTEVDTAITGGTNVLTNPDMTAGLDRGHFLSRTGNCQTFDEEADGYCRGEGVATIILKRLDDAVVDKDPILGVIRGIATNHSAEAASITRPHVGAQRELFEKILNSTGIHAGQISYVEMHGTGTQVGDAGETTSVLETFAPSSPGKQRAPHEPLYIGSVKANVGHGEAVAGATSLAKVLLMLKNSVIPPHCGIKRRINHRIPDLKPRNTYIAEAPIPWTRPDNQVRRVFLNNFSAAGGNTALVVEDGPILSLSSDPDPRATHLVAVSAKTYASLEGNLKSYISWIERTPEHVLTLPRASYTSTTRRLHYPHRVAAIGSTLQEIKVSLEGSLLRKDGSFRPTKSPEICFAFTGQGSQYQGMGCDLFALYSSFRSDILRYDQMAQTLNFPSFRGVFERSESLAGVSPAIVQLASACLQMALVRLLSSWGVTPKAVVGHSLGEYAALNAAGVLSESDTIFLVGTRALLLECHCKQETHAMLAVRAPLPDIQQHLGAGNHSYDVSCYNGMEEIVLGASREEIEKIRDVLEQNGIKTTMLNIPYAFHTSQVDHILPEYQRLSQGASFRKASLPIISPHLGQVIQEGETIGPEYLADHCRKSVDILGATQTAKIDGVLGEKTVTIEIGPAPVVSKMVKKVVGSNMKILHCLQRQQSAAILIPQILAHLYSSGAEINWSDYHHEFESAQEVLDLPTYHWELKDYWIQYVNHWSLRKGDPLPQPSILKIESSTVHRLVKEEIGAHGGELVIESDLIRPEMHAVVQGHKVWGVPLCTPSVYADIAMTVGRYIHQRYHSQSSQSHVEVGSMNIQSALVANSAGTPQLLRATFELGESKKSATCKFFSVDENDKVIEQHSNCLIQFFSAEDSLSKLKDKHVDIKSRMELIQKQISERGNTYRFSKSMIYKMITQLADFDPNYRGLVEITLDNDKLEACGRVSFKDVKKGGDFHTNPAYIDALSQLGGFVMNANEGVDLTKEVFINHGWESMRLFEPIDESKTYETHVGMREHEGNLWKGDVTIFEAGRVVGRFGGVALQGVPKRLMEVIIDSASKRSQRKQVIKSKSPAIIFNPAPTPTLKATTTAQKGGSELVVRAMEILSEESGVALEELSDSCQLADTGIDSLMSLVIGSRYRDDLDIDLDSDTLIDFVTVKDLKEYIRSYAGEDVQAQTPATTPSTMHSKPVLPLQTNMVEPNSMWSDALRIISEESGISLAELNDETAFTDIGIDSLLALVIGSRYRDELDLDLPLDASLFIDNRTIKDLRNSIFQNTDISSNVSEPSTGSSPQTESSSTDNTSPANTPTEAEDSEQVQKQLASVLVKERSHDGMAFPQSANDIRAAWSLVLQGSPRKAGKILFLFPDGCGAASSYLGLPRISPSVAVIGFNSPFMKNPSQMQKQTLNSVLSSYIQGVRHHQAHGPYFLGGWSAGGILAYAIAKILIAEGEKVESLICIDSPAPTKGLDRLPQRFFDHCSAVGLFGKELSKNSQSRPTDSGSSKIPEWLMPHFHATIEMLHDYVAPPMPVDGTAPRANLMWAGECALDGARYPKLPTATIEDEDTEGMAFLTEKRSDFGPGDWGTLFPGQDIRTSTVLGEDHFSMMRGTGGAQISEFIKAAMGLA